MSTVELEDLDDIESGGEDTKEKKGDDEDWVTEDDESEEEDSSANESPKIQDQIEGSNHHEPHESASENKPKDDHSDKEDDKEPEWTDEERQTRAIRNFVCIPAVYTGQLCTDKHMRLRNYTVMVTGISYGVMQGLHSSKWLSEPDSNFTVMKYSSRKYDQLRQSSQRPQQSSVELDTHARLKFVTKQKKENSLFFRGDYETSAKLLKTMLFLPVDSQDVQITIKHNAKKKTHISVQVRMQDMRRISPKQLSSLLDVGQTKEKCLYLKNLPPSVTSTSVKMLFPCCLTAKATKTHKEGRWCVLTMPSSSVANKHLFAYHDLVINGHPIEMFTATMTQEDAMRLLEDKAGRKRKDWEARLTALLSRHDHQGHQFAHTHQPHQPQQPQQAQPKTMTKKEKKKNKSIINRLDQQLGNQKKPAEQKEQKKKPDPYMNYFQNGSAESYQGRGPGPSPTAPGYGPGGAYSSESLGLMERQLAHQQELERLQLEKLRVLAEMKQKVLLQEQLYLANMRGETALKSEALLRQPGSGRGYNPGDCFAPGRSSYSNLTSGPGLLDPPSGYSGAASFTDWRSQKGLLDDPYSSAAAAPYANLTSDMMAENHCRYQLEALSLGSSLGPGRWPNDLEESREFHFDRRDDFGVGGYMNDALSRGPNELTFNITDKEASRLIGQGGRMLRKLIDDSRAMINIPRPQPGHTGRTVTIAGTASQVLTAHNIIQKLLERRRTKSKE